MEREGLGGRERRGWWKMVPEIYLLSDRDVALRRGCRGNERRAGMEHSLTAHTEPLHESGGGSYSLRPAINPFTRITISSLWAGETKKCPVISGYANT